MSGYPGNAKKALAVRGRYHPRLSLEGYGVSVKPIHTDSPLHPAQFGKAAYTG
jgi:hypothetical protein